MARLPALFLCVVLIGLGGRAEACINDNESPTHEREFRSQYGGLASLPSSDESSPRRVPVDVLMGSGAVMLIGSFALTVTRARSRS